MGEEWDDSLQSKEQIEAKLLSKYEATTRRERALAYAFTHQVFLFFSTIYTCEEMDEKFNMNRKIF